MFEMGHQDCYQQADPYVSGILLPDWLMVLVSTVYVYGSQIHEVPTWVLHNSTMYHMHQRRRGGIPSYFRENGMYRHIALYPDLPAYTLIFTRDYFFYHSKSGNVWSIW